ncbi:hypothetical protein PHYBLDRAFT_168471 [Phycomyces blakesleeanus NRRL 1555(-)]|uniref:Uncharacterized protein n=1 Tax=Phycomyces blakesleeanus (strain ATCC 8743b / DSM 1359 / FGSC 10004 / NBRC 33097 / NRRL 1555) TaxID=763407 RepID=A0A167MUU1_PHYB8|nr:hypothetical protein PHYBLDRAFT_168471 [Phycomyces blakesleeanus NRRL 1555(-)]OAD74064.1 hypothetical protein PHYBLDRAFT_168471 [Phycomyces blakesleeanus NRRL 1555(-)]|eukprot:XP_018292104.1 hypothetical protein PHYBLDRAFT_168471 [Phycomyces blakesleeanus NRRL 1555(-)]
MLKLLFNKHSAFSIIENMLLLYPIATEDPKQQAFNKPNAKTPYHIENTFGLLVQKCCFLLRHLYFLETFPKTLHDFENKIQNFDAYSDGNDDNDVKIEVEDLDLFINKIPVNLENASLTANCSVRQIQSAHDLSQERGRQRRERMTERKSQLAIITLQKLLGLPYVKEGRILI